MKLLPASRICTVAGTILHAAGHKTIGLHTNLFAESEFGKTAEQVPEIRKDLRD
jgi:hypothetical protein